MPGVWLAVELRRILTKSENFKKRYGRISNWRFLSRAGSLLAGQDWTSFKVFLFSHYIFTHEHIYIKSLFNYFRRD